MLKENTITPPAGNVWHDACYNSAGNKIYYRNNRCNRNKNTVVIEINKKLFKNQRPSLSDA